MSSHTKSTGAGFSPQRSSGASRPTTEAERTSDARLRVSDPRVRGEPTDEELLLYARLPSTRHRGAAGRPPVTFNHNHAPENGPRASGSQAQAVAAAAGPTASGDAIAEERLPENLPVWPIERLEYELALALAYADMSESEDSSDSDLEEAPASERAQVLRAVKPRMR